MSDFTPSIIPLGSLARAAADAAAIAQDEYALSAIDDGTLIGDTSEPPAWP